MRTKQTISDRVRIAREARGLGSRQLDQRAGLSSGHTAVIEGRSKSSLDTDTAQKLAKALGVSLDWLITGAGDGPATAVV